MHIDKDTGLITLTPIENDPDGRIADTTTANAIGLHLLNVIEQLATAADRTIAANVNIDKLKELLSSQTEIVEMFFIINVILKGFLVLLEGDEWLEAIKNQENHLYPPSTIAFLKKVHSHEFVRPVPPHEQKNKPKRPKDAPPIVRLQK